MRFLFFCFSILFFPWSVVLAQSVKTTIQEFYPYKNEIGINFTNVLGNALSLNPNNVNSPYGLTYRRHIGNYSFRSGLNVSVTNKNEDDFSNGLFITRNLTDKFSDFRLGFERHLVLSRRFLFSYGIDFLGSVKLEHSSILDNGINGNTFISDKNTYGAGLGPVLRLEFKISDRFFLSTESTLYAFKSNTIQKLNINGQQSEDTKTTSSSFILQLPQSLFFNISF